ncbi:transcriptional regulator [Rhodanobacter sp. FW510-R12]|uniref:winged helix-turn-helix transcriptional regulator n=1 Tax=unclassified Rhodanobacter TaxID=2621553 RepID=UPI0007AA4A53|nr:MULTISPECIES: helix-turn-helix domain-containing protein [unclassified Rhodanobacter]KZC17130.1 transcriptional regulator [Rhodanobacter sp. FW104-R8]KZC28641.1 transcriptional regulator [Rhodanobacter sp. FW510-T8]KZC29393.1 transcriptional regulator [Rhodanobacter sp. FW510-R10]
MGLPVRKSKVTAPPACPLTESLALLRGAWAPNVVWYLSAEPRRFGELRHDIPRISARVLSARLRELESRGLVTRRVLDTSPPSAEYALTPLGRELLPAIRALASVGQKLIAEWEAGASKRAPAAARGTISGGHRQARATGP